MPNIAVLVSGRGSNLQAIIDSIEADYLKAQIAVVISDVENAYALERARRHEIEAVFIDPKRFTSKELYEKEIIRLLKNHGVELILLAGYMRIVGDVLLSAYKNRILNIHPSLLPAFTGLHAQKQAFDYGVKVAGCTVHFVDETLDRGPIILQRCVEIKEDDTPETLADRILEQEHKIYPEAVKLFVENRLRIEGRKVRIIE
ncbi:formyltetrahydrofolate-dependent phosphoribosylglycinamide formyltransferase [Candidatus Methanoperedens nitroreducens]|uniref:phosphoribosylglycinamide formyltransferase 1 n=1 Tax=Candidatus Methanoperedens nitratireducens TaxID=1392998 RepID=A0A062V3H7_9EURY|nr:phosphoribosylglycinamide formyltransferase [Candidatus Methanoperedens nitroreducens]KCZ70369.1 formyltetrahydrofolate-dependent phosphoribosylglycinamide formyltransferase [Candidatus Methanoperedens nitroreducens]MDJ1420808.1 phosphoribosylglycinamide formyltransferase [Candidatus Methanoperedens sp.]